ncbi:MAG: hypothetical protein JWM43_1761 [Acidobacteriaceae bacterium]|nr:hypothetical protein [Acidobacteriaceae bacterium]
MSRTEKNGEPKLSVSRFAPLEKDEQGRVDQG